MTVDLPSPVVLVITGVSGAGKTTVGTLLAERLGWPFKEGDSLHPLNNVEKMAAGIPLTDEDRWPWLTYIADWVDGQLDSGQNGVITCSALKRAYRLLINRRGSGVEFVYLAVGKDELEERVEHRDGHFMPASLLNSQLATLEVPTDSEPAIRVDAGPDASLVVDRLLRDLGLMAQATHLPTSPAKKSAPRAKPATSKRTPRAKS
jgi:gluconokinase